MQNQNKDKTSTHDRCVSVEGHEPGWRAKGLCQDPYSLLPLMGASQRPTSLARVPAMRNSDHLPLTDHSTQEHSSRPFLSQSMRSWKLLSGIHDPSYGAGWLSMTQAGGRCLERGYFGLDQTDMEEISSSETCRNRINQRPDFKGISIVRKGLFVFRP